MKKMLKRLCTGFLALATVVTALPTTPVHAESKQYWTESKERVGIVEKVMNDGSIGSTFNEGHLTVEGEDAYCIDINTDFKNGYKTRADASSRMNIDQISDVALSIEYVKQYTDSHSGISKNHAYLLRQLVVWQRLSVHLGWQCDNVRASYDEIPKATQDEVFSGAKAFVKENKGRYECGGYIYSGEGQELGQFWANLNVGNATLKKSSSNTSITENNGNYSIAGATYGVFADKDCNEQLATLTTDSNGNTEVVEVKAGTVYIKELSAPKGYKVDDTVYSLKVEVGKTATLNVSDTPKVTNTLIELFKIDMETQKDNPQGNASLEGAEFTWKYYDGYYNKNNLPEKATRTWTTKTIAEKDSDGTIHYVTKLADAYKVSGDSFYMQDGKAVLPLGTLTVEETKAPNGYLLDGAYMQAGDKSEQMKGKLNDLSSDERLKQRQVVIKPLVDAFFTYLKTINVSKKDKFGDAIGYALNQEKYLRVFLTDGDVPIDNNASERAIRGFCIGKKNWQMIDTINGAKSSAIIYSIVETAKANNLKPFDYVQYLLEEIPKHMNDRDCSFLENLLPWSEKLPVEIHKA